MPRLRQVALAAGDLDAAVSVLCERLGVAVCFRDPGVAHFGLRNAVMAVGRDFLEVVSPLRAEAPAARFLARRGGDGGYMAIFQVDDLAAARARADRLGVRVVFEHTQHVPARGQRAGREPATRTATLHLHPRDVGAAIVSLDVSDPPESWAWAGPDWERRAGAGRAHGIAGLDLAASDPEALARRWAALLDRPVRRLPEGGFAIALDDGVLRFREGAEGIHAVDLRAAEPTQAGAAFEVAGTRIRLVPAAGRAP